MASWEEFGVATGFLGTVPGDQRDAAARKLAEKIPGFETLKPADFQQLQQRIRDLIYDGGPGPDQIVATAQRDFMPKASAASRVVRKALGDTSTQKNEVADPNAAARGGLSGGLDRLYGNVAGLQNPYSEENLNRLRGQMSLDFRDQQNQLSSTLASRGLLGSGMEAGRRTALGGQQGLGLNNLAVKFGAGQSDWEMGRQKQLADLQVQKQQLGLQAGTQDLERQKWAYQQQQDDYNRQQANTQGAWQTGMNIGTGLTTAGLLAAAPFTGGATLPFAALTGNAFLSGISKGPMSGGGLPYDPKMYGYAPPVSGKTAVGQVQSPQRPSLGNYYQGPEHSRYYEDMATMGRGDY